MLWNANLQILELVIIDKYWVDAVDGKDDEHEDRHQFGRLLVSIMKAMQRRLGLLQDGA